MKTPCNPDDIEEVINDFFEVARKGWPEAIQKALTAESQVEKLKAEIVEAHKETQESLSHLCKVTEHMRTLKAQCAVMREILKKALQALKAPMHERNQCNCQDRSGEGCPGCQGDEERLKARVAIKVALSSDAGQHLLEKLKKLEIVAEEAQALIDEWDSDVTGVFDIHDLDGLRQALAELGSGEQTDD